LCNCSHDRETETCAGHVPRSLRAGEPFEGASEKRGREAAALVGDMNYDQAVVFDRLESQRSGAVTKRILDQVCERLLEPTPIAEHVEV
jgi:hypothetical protein